MTIWNVHLGQKKVPVRVKSVLEKKSEFMIIVDSRGRQHRLSEVDFPFFEWEKIGPGSTFVLTVSESVTRWKIQPSRIDKTVEKLITETAKKDSGLFFVWICQYCNKRGFIGYEEGDDPQGIANRVVLTHKEAARVGCKEDIRIFDHRGIEQPDSELFLSTQRVVEKREGE